MARAKLSEALLARTPVSIGAGSQESAASPTGEERGGKPIALTLKVDQARYEALKILGARTRRSNQEILLAALDKYLHAARD